MPSLQPIGCRGDIQILRDYSVTLGRSWPGHFGAFVCARCLACRRRDTVHPLWERELLGLINPLLPAPMIEYPHETTRCAVDLVVSKRVRENPDWKIVFMPFRGHSSVHRNASWSTAFPCKFLVCYSWGVSRRLSEILLWRCPKQAIELLMKFADPSRVFYGSDYPYCPDKTIDVLTNQLDSASLTEEQLSDINTRNALKLFPQLAEGKWTGKISCLPLRQISLVYSLSVHLFWLSVVVLLFLNDYVLLEHQ